MKSKIISEIKFTQQPESAKLSEEVDTISERDSFLQDQNQCVLCGSTLKLSHKIDHSQLTASEKADCIVCQISLRRTSATLH